MITLKNNGKTGGFTLVEMLMVIAIIGILAGLSLMGVNAAKKRAYTTRAQAEVRELMRAWGTYWITFEKWPDDVKGGTNVQMTAEKMAHLLGGNDMNLYFIDAGAKARAEGMKDPWGNYYRVDFSQTRFESNDVYETCISFPMNRRYQYEQYVQ